MDTVYSGVFGLGPDTYPRINKTGMASSHFLDISIINALNYDLYLKSSGMD